MAKKFSKNQNFLKSKAEMIFKSILKQATQNDSALELAAKKN
jgi:hypothetical protein